MKLEEGMYVRTYNGTIFKIVGGNEDKWYIDISYSCLSRLEDEDYTSYSYNKNNSFFKSLAKKASHNPIDLIEVGDYVNGYKVLEICTGNFELNNPLNVKALKLEFIKEDINPNIPFFKRYNFITNSEIKSIITKEQFESVKYEVKKDE